METTSKSGRNKRVERVYLGDFMANGPVYPPNSIGGPFELTMAISPSTFFLNEKRLEPPEDFWKVVVQWMTAMHDLYKAHHLVNGDVSPANVAFRREKDGSVVGIVHDFDDKYDRSHLRGRDV